MEKEKICQEMKQLNIPMQKIKNLKEGSQSIPCALCKNQFRMDHRPKWNSNTIKLSEKI